MTASPRRDHLVETALELFSRDGYHATGIDKILAEAGVAKMTLYKHFESKDALILAALRLRDERFRDWLTDEVERRAQAPRARLLAIFEALEDWFAEDTFSGCSFINAAAEFADPDNPIHIAAAEHKALIAAYVRDLAAGAGAADPEELTRRIELLIEGAIVVTQVSGRADAAHAAGRAAAVLIADAIV